MFLKTTVPGQFILTWAWQYLATLAIPRRRNGEAGEVANYDAFQELESLAWNSSDGLWPILSCCTSQWPDITSHNSHSISHSL